MRRLWERVRFWLWVRRECILCIPSRWLGGNPFAREIKYGVCPACRWRLEIAELIERSKK